MRSRRELRWIGVVPVIAGAAVARACTVCDSAAGHAVRSGIFDGHFLWLAARLLAPFPVFAAAAAGLYFGLPVPAAAATKSGA